MKFVCSGIFSFLLFAAASQAYGQATVITTSGLASGTTASFTYTPAAGFNRVLVISVSREYTAAAGTVTGITYGTQAFILARAHAPSANITAEMWYLPEARIRAGGYCSATITVTWTTNTNLSSQAYSIMTVESVDQTNVLQNGGGNNVSSAANGANSTTLAVGSMTAPLAQDLVVYATTAENQTRTHTESTGYTERHDFSAGTHRLATATKAIGASGAENPTATWSNPSRITIVGAVFNGVNAGPTTTQTYYSLTTGDWDANTTWSLTENGSSGAIQSGVWPRRTDNVIIKAGHIVTINALDDNKTCGVTAASLALGNVGPFASSTETTFYHTGHITVRGTLTLVGGTIEMMVAGNTTVVTGGTFTTASDLYNLGYFEVQTSSSFTTYGNFVITGNSTSLINAAVTITNDFGIDWTNATICGSGTATLNLGPGSGIDLTNGATLAQMCTNFSVVCGGVGCTGTPAVGTTVAVVGNSGPGGVGNSSNNRLWLRSTDISQANNTAVSTWTDASGNGLNATQGTAGLQPRFFTNVVNTVVPVVRFDGASTDYLSVGQSALLDFTPRTDVHSYFAAVNVANNANGTVISRALNGSRQWQYTVDAGTPNRFAYFRGGDFSTGSQVATAAWKIPAAIVGTNAATGFTGFANGTADVAATTVGTATAAATDVLVGARRDLNNTDAGFYLTGDIGEIILYDVELQTVHRVLIENYLAAKFNITGLGTEAFTRDGAGFDFDVAGIGQVASGGSHKDAKGRGIVRMWNSSALSDGEFLMWGHDNATLISVSTTDVGPGIAERLSRIWSCTMTGDVGTVNISFDLSGFPGTHEASELRLLIDRDNNFTTNDVAPISGGMLAGGVLTFTAVDFNDADRFTLGNVSVINLLPIGLVDFRAVPDRDVVKLNWTTLSEVNNDFFTVERSINGEQWDDIASVKGAGTSSKKLQYSAVDDRPVNGVSYYRLRQNDFDGTFTYSTVQRIELEGIVRLNVFPNPSQGSFTITGSDDLTLADVQMLDVLGRPVAAAVTKEADSVSVDPTGVASGVYFIRVTTATWARTVRVVRE